MERVERENNILIKREIKLQRKKLHKCSTKRPAMNWYVIEENIYGKAKRVT